MTEQMQTQMQYSKFRTATVSVLVDHAKELFQRDLNAGLTTHELRAEVKKLYDEHSMTMPGAPAEEPPAPKVQSLDGEDAISEVIDEAPIPEAPVDPEEVWMRNCYGDNFVDADGLPKPPIARPGKLEKRIRVTIYPEENAADHVPIGVNGRALSIKRDEPADIPYPYFTVLEHANKTDIIMIEGVEKGRNTRRFNYQVHGMIWYRDRKPASELEPFIRGN